MVTVTATTSSTSQSSAARTGDNTLRRWLYAALVVGTLWGVALTFVELALTTTEDGHPFQHSADYWLTGLGIPLCLSGLVIVHTMHTLATARDGRRGRWGVVVFSVPALVFTAMFIEALIAGEASSWGPTYLLCVLATDVGLGLLVAGLWRTGLLPRKLLGLWWVGWFLGGPLGPPAFPLLLSAAYVVLALELRRSSPQRAHATVGFSR